MVSTNDAERAELYAKAQEIVMKDAPWGRSSPSRTSTRPPRGSGVYVMPDGNIDSGEIAVAP